MRTFKEDHVNRHSASGAPFRIGISMGGVPARKARILTVSLIASLLLGLVVVTGCDGGRQDYFHLFSFPQGLDALVGKWEYRMRVDVYWDQGSYDARSDKDVQIRIEDKTLHYILNDTLHFSNVAAVEATTSWQDFAAPTVELFERGYPYEPGDAYNQQLLKSGPRLLRKITYRYDEQTKTFKSVSATP